MKLKPQHIIPYLNYKLMMKSESKSRPMIRELTYRNWGNKKISLGQAIQWKYKPLLLPLSSLTKKELEELGLILIEGAGRRNYEKAAKQWLSNNVYKAYGTMKISMSVAFVALNWCYKKHLDLFGWIDKGLAIKKV